ncbi:hypothetical protein BJV74DRAFT_866294 [Russula compacta]|nr:hypothetical protein BJV74DRAFT_866294 [Russula compacta]
MPDGFHQAGQGQNVTPPSSNPAFQGCTCSWCSVTRQNGPTAPRISEHQGPWFMGGQAASYANQYLATDEIPAATGIAATMTDQIQPEFVGPPEVAENAGYPLPYEAGGSLQVQPDQTQVVGSSVTESLRRLAGSYVNHPESVVNAVRYEPGHSGRFQVIITMEIIDIL